VVRWCCPVEEAAVLGSRIQDLTMEVGDGWVGGWRSRASSQYPIILAVVGDSSFLAGTAGGKGTLRWCSVGGWQGAGEQCPIILEVVQD
jgi:hypothetical protein